MMPTWLTPTTVLRLKQAYRESIATFSGHGESPLWTMIREKQIEIHKSLMSDDDSLTSLLADPCKTYLYYGVDNLYPRKDPKESPNRQCLETYAHDTLIIFADAVGATRYWNPEGGSLFPYKESKPDRSVDDLLKDIEKILDISLQFPTPFPNAVGLPTGRGVVNHLAVNAIYQAYRVKQISKGEHRCLEIGGGVGRTAYYARMLGIYNYTLVDLPMTMIGQALFLIATLGPDAVWLFGEPSSEQHGRIRLAPPSFVTGLSERFDIVLNVDSFTEMDRSHAKEYVDFAMAHADVLLSINHEANKFMTRELISGVLFSRSPYWLRSGYVEELYVPH